jgi:hypothetical protein
MLETIGNLSKEELEKYSENVLLTYYTHSGLEILTITNIYFKTEGWKFLLGNYSKVIDRKCKMLKEISKVSEKYKLSKKPMEYINKIIDDYEK